MLLVGMKEGWNKRVYAYVFWEGSVLGLRIALGLDEIPKG